MAEEEIDIAASFCLIRHKDLVQEPHRHEESDAIWFLVALAFIEIKIVVRIHHCIRRQFPWIIMKLLKCQGFSSK